MSAKENDGKARRRYQLRKIFIAVSVCLIIILVKHVFVGNKKVDISLRNGRTLETKEKDSGRSTLPNESVELNDIEKILRAELHLTDVYDVVSGNGLKKNIAAEFCHLNWKLHKTEPSKYAMFRDLVSHSCGGQHIQIDDIKQIARLARERDEADEQTKSLPLEGVVFHESRVGSTLVSNSLAASNPTAHRVYSESAPPIALLRKCEDMGDHFCTSPATVALFRDIVYLMGRTSDAAETSMFFKIQSVGTKGISLFRAAFPEVPWIFVYREPVQVMMSHLKLPSGVSITKSNCLRSFKNPSRSYKELAKKLGGGRKLKELSYEDHCALHLASICQSAVDEQSKSHTGRMVNYANLPQVLSDDIFPNHFGIRITDIERQNIEDVSTHYSKGRHTNKKWNEEGDSEKKERLANDAVKEASNTFLRPSFEWFENENKNLSDGV